MNLFTADRLTEYVQIINSHAVQYLQLNTDPHSYIHNTHINEQMNEMILVRILRDIYKNALQIVCC